MAHINSFEDMRAWQEARILTIALYEAFSNCRDRAFKDQILRAGVSVMNNLAEGFERSTDKELRQFLFIAKGSAGEVRSMLSIASSLGYLTELEVTEFTNRVTAISKMIAVFIKSLAKDTL